MDVFSGNLISIYLKRLETAAALFQPFFPLIKRLVGFTPTFFRFRSLPINTASNCNFARMTVFFVFLPYEKVR